MRHYNADIQHGLNGEAPGIFPGSIHSHSTFWNRWLIKAVKGKICKYHQSAPTPPKKNVIYREWTRWDKWRPKKSKAMPLMGTRLVQILQTCPTQLQMIANQDLKTTQASLSVEVTLPEAQSGACGGADIVAAGLQSAARDGGVIEEMWSINEGLIKDRGPSCFILLPLPASPPPPLWPLSPPPLQVALSILFKFAVFPSRRKKPRAWCPVYAAAHCRHHRHQQQHPPPDQYSPTLGAIGVCCARWERHLSSLTPPVCFYYFPIILSIFPNRLGGTRVFQPCAWRCVGVCICVCACVRVYMSYRAKWFSRS